MRLRVPPTTLSIRRHIWEYMQRQDRDYWIEMMGNPFPVINERGYAPGSGQHVIAAAILLRVPLLTVYMNHS